MPGWGGLGAARVSPCPPPPIPLPPAPHLPRRCRPAAAIPWGRASRGPPGTDPQGETPAFLSPRIPQQRAPQSERPPSNPSTGYPPPRTHQSPPRAWVPKMLGLRCAPPPPGRGFSSFPMGKGRWEPLPVQHPHQGPPWGQPGGLPSQPPPSPTDDTGQLQRGGHHWGRGSP